MSLTIKAATAMHFAGAAYAAGDTIDTTGMNDRSIAVLLKHQPVYVSAASSAPPAAVVIDFTGTTVSGVNAWDSDGSQVITSLASGFSAVTATFPWLKITDDGSQITVASHKRIYGDIQTTSTAGGRVEVFPDGWSVGGGFVVPATADGFLMDFPLILMGTPTAWEVPSDDPGFDRLRIAATALDVLKLYLYDPNS